MVEEIKNYFIELASKEVGSYNYNYWENHVKYVVQISKELALQNNASLEVVEISAILHDIAKVLNLEKEKSHNLVGSLFAVQLLKEKGYDETKIEKVRKCILYHGGDLDSNIKLSSEEWCVRNADILSLFNNISIFYHLAFNELNLNYQDGRNYIKEMILSKYSRLDNKLKEIYNEKFEIIYNSI